MKYGSKDSEARILTFGTFTRVLSHPICRIIHEAVEARRGEAGLNPANLPIGPPHPATRQLKPAQAGEEFSQLPASITVTVTGTAESARLNS